VVTTSTGALVHLNNANARLVMKDGAVLKNNRATNGGGVYINQNSSLTMVGGSISGNKAVSGGGVCIPGNNKFTMEGGTIFGNTASSTGGGVCVGLFGYAGISNFFLNSPATKASIYNNTAASGSPQVHITGSNSIFQVNGTSETSY
jgi:hypothetical protein